MPHFGTHSQCEEGWTEYNGMCYISSAVSPDDMRTWSDSRAECQKMGAWLATSDSEDIHDFLVSNVVTSTGTWIGLYVHENYSDTSVWRWSDGAEYDKNWNKWNTSTTINHTCAVVAGEFWRDMACIETRGYICKKDFHTEFGCNAGWEALEDRHCYLFVNNSSQTNADAAMWCYRHDSTLASILNDTEHDFVRDKVQGLEMWIGLTTLYWDNSDAVYSWNNFTSSPTLAPSPTKRCTRIQSGNTWANMECEGYVNNYICQKEATHDNSTAIIQPTVLSTDQETITSFTTILSSEQATTSITDTISTKQPDVTTTESRPSTTASDATTVETIVTTTQETATTTKAVETTTKAGTTTTAESIITTIKPIETSTGTTRHSEVTTTTEAGETTEEPSDEPDYFILWIVLGTLIGVAVVIVIILLIIYLYLRHKDKKESDSVHYAETNCSDSDDENTRFVDADHTLVSETGFDNPDDSNFEIQPYATRRSDKQVSNTNAYASISSKHGSNHKPSANKHVKRSGDSGHAAVNKKGVQGNNQAEASTKVHPKTDDQTGIIPLYAEVNKVKSRQNKTDDAKLHEKRLSENSGNGSDSEIAAVYAEVNTGSSGANQSKGSKTQKSSEDNENDNITAAPVYAVVNNKKKTNNLQGEAEAHEENKETTGNHTQIDTNDNLYENGLSHNSNDVQEVNKRVKPKKQKTKLPVKPRLSKLFQFGNKEEKENDQQDDTSVLYENLNNEPKILNSEEPRKNSKSKKVNKPLNTEVVLSNNAKEVENESKNSNNEVEMRKKPKSPKPRIPTKPTPSKIPKTHKKDKIEQKQNQEDGLTSDDNEALDSNDEVVLRKKTKEKDMDDEPQYLNSEAMRQHDKGLDVDNEPQSSNPEIEMREKQKPRIPTKPPPNQIEILLNDQKDGVVYAELDQEAFNRPSINYVRTEENDDSVLYAEMVSSK